ncbi:MAG: hypothetical protein JJU27_19275, partial [Gammaproteobacteria bacterium]|nr:hypothetical protein [Gammaproteobacteria bacterium]
MTGMPDSISGRLAPLLGLALVLVIVAAAAISMRLDTARAEPPLPDLASVEDPDELKQRFIEYLHPFVEEANSAVERKRARLLSIAARHEARGVITRIDQWWLAGQAR